jgi:hypothetical protein
VGLHAGYTSSLARQDALVDWLGHDNTALANRPPATRLGQNPSLLRPKGPFLRPDLAGPTTAVAGGGEKCRRRPTTAVAQRPCGGPSLRSRSLQEGSMHDDVNNVLGNET